MISDAEQTSQRRHSDSESSKNSQESTSYCDGVEDDEFLSKVCKFELISRGKHSPTAKSPVNKSPGKFNITSPDSRSGRRSGENFYFGEKLFTKDTATTRVSASILQTARPLQPDFHSQDVNTNAVCSFGSVSTRRKSNESRNSGSSVKSRSSGKGNDSQSISENDTMLNSASSFFNTPVSPVRKTELSTLPFFETSELQRPGSGSYREPTLVLKATHASPKVAVNTVSCYPDKKDGNRTDSSWKKREENGKDLGKDYLSVEKDDSDTSGSRNTFDGIDFDFNELTESQKDLTLKHREIVAERKQEQEMERLERQRLEEILNMCAEYEKQIEAEQVHTFKQKTEKFITTEKALIPPIPPLPVQYQHLQSNNNNKGRCLSRLSTVQQQMQPERQAQVPKGLDLDIYMERRDVAKSEYRSSMTNKIMTNGSLTILSSPTNSQKEFFLGYQMRKCGSNSSNSEEESLCGSPEDTGTIKRRPTSSQSPFCTERPKSPRTSPRSPTLVSSKSSVHLNKVSFSSDQSHSSIHYSSAFSSPSQTFPTTAVSWSQNSMTQAQTSIQNDFAKKFKIEPLRLTSVSVEFVERKHTENFEERSHASTYSEPECDLQMKEDLVTELQIHEPVTSKTYKGTKDEVDHTRTNLDASPLSTFCVPSTESGTYPSYGGTSLSQCKNLDHHDYVNINGSHCSDSNSESPSSSCASTVCPTSFHGFINNILSNGSPRSSGSISESKSSSIENVTPINSDNEFNTILIKEQSSRASSTGTTDSSECSWGTIDVSTVFSFFIIQRGTLSFFCCTLICRQSCFSYATAASAMRGI